MSLCVCVCVRVRVRERERERERERGGGRETGIVIAVPGVQIGAASASKAKYTRLCEAFDSAATKVLTPYQDTLCPESGSDCLTSRIWP